MNEDRSKKVAVIIPAHNEASRIESVLRAVTSSRLVSQVIVVDDGSSDGTSEVARRIPNVEVLTLKKNVGKAGAMAAGVKRTDAPILAFVDADLGGLKSEHLDRIIVPLLKDQCDMCVGIFKGGKAWSDAAQTVSPYLSGQRALRREIFEAVPYVQNLGLGIEVALNKVAKRRKARVLRVILRGVSNCHKEVKVGIVKGLGGRLKMFGEISMAFVKPSKPKKRKKWF
jgi:glycosyltransferase involved in cell wall biosynthesis